MEWISRYVGACHTFERTSWGTDPFKKVKKPKKKNCILCFFCFSLKNKNTQTAKKKKISNRNQKTTKLIL
jgi:hypothetical protein